MAPAPHAPAHHRAGLETVVRAALPGTPLAPGAARRLVREALADRAALALPGAETVGERLRDDAVVIVSELVTNAVVHAGTDVELVCRLEIGDDGGPGVLDAVIVEVSDHHPSRAVREDAAERPYGTPEYGRGLRLVSTLSEAWGITYRTGVKTVWARLPVDGAAEFGAGFGLEGETGDATGTGVAGEAGVDRVSGDRGPGAVAWTGGAGPGGGAETGAYAGDCGIGAPGGGTTTAEPRRDPSRDHDWLNRGALSFLAEASDLLAGQLDEDLVAALAGQLLVPRLADWCAVWLEDEATDRAGGLGLALGPRLARVWHGSENRIEELRGALEKDPPRLPDSVRSRAVPVPWPGETLGAGDMLAGAGGGSGAAGVGGAALAYRLIAGGRPLGTLVIGRAGLTCFPDEITGLVEDLSRRIALAIGAARQYARQATISRVLQRGLLPGAVAEIPGVRSALVYEPLDKGGPSGDFYDLFPAGDGRWCFVLGDVQGKGPEAAVVIGLARPWVRLLAREGYQVADVLDRLNQLLLDDATEAADAAARALVAAGGPGLGPDEGPQTRFLSMLYGELVPFDGGVRCTLASAGHPLPLILGPDGDVREVAEPQTLLGVFEDATYVSETLDLYPGDTVLCVTDGVTERRSGPRQFDDDEGLAQALASCTGLGAELVAERIRRLVHEFGSKPPEDDLALLVLQAE
ncbi:SpoIIE family protein phosphatase [Streptomyces sp. NBC_01571]|uniref:ATP-binding SpoIIE family protein phosphatase n=1 Tax=Streptomyces sp. NBC_01571 TaxID=2975883 RepID=UPI002255F348|nr:ATP-binding SpoIIE family protein phosphatase [Streptomyces sp. NBC_01571]MCX4574898.1 SpoIIE family protein phosphatase [Streptomyces sp. NBC_01571]